MFFFLLLDLRFWISKSARTGWKEGDDAGSGDAVL